MYNLYGEEVIILPRDHPQKIHSLLHTRQPMNGGSNRTLAVKLRQLP